MDADLNAKIGDFGLSTKYRAGELLTASCGSPYYTAPELLTEACKYEGPPVDVWALGVILYVLLCPSQPFDGPDLSTIFKKIKSGCYPVPEFLSAEAKSLIGRMLVVDPSERASIAEIRNHPWFQADFPEGLQANRSVAAAEKETLQRCATVSTMGSDSRSCSSVSLNSIVQDEAAPSQPAHQTS